MLEIDFDQVNTQPADVPFYAGIEADVKIPPYLAVRCLNEGRCMDCHEAADKQRGLMAWLALRDDARTPTHWVVLCDEHFEKTNRRKPMIFP
jgi:hypothetical protein